MPAWMPSGLRVIGASSMHRVPLKFTGRAWGVRPCLPPRPSVRWGHVLLLVAALATAACVRDQLADEFPPGSCVTFSGGGENWEIAGATCDGPHTHVVTSWLPDRHAVCPPPATDQGLTPSGTLCLRAADAGSGEP